MRALAAFAVLLLVTACQAPPEMTDAEIAQIEAEVLEAMEANFDGWRQHSVDMIMASFHPTATSWVVGSTPRDFGGVTDWVTSWVEGYSKWEGGWIETTVTVLSRDAAIFQGTYECTTTRNDGRMMLFPGNATWTNLLERTDDGWRITKGANSNGAGHRIDQLYGTYDWTTLGGQTLPSDSLTSGWLEWRPDGSFTSYEILADGSGTVELLGHTSVGQFVDDCFQFEAWLDEDPEASFSGTVCDDVMTGDDGLPFEGRKRG